MEEEIRSQLQANAESINDQTNYDSSLQAARQEDAVLVKQAQKAKAKFEILRKLVLAK